MGIGGDSLMQYVAHSDNHVAAVREELSQENNSQCKELGEEYIRLFRDIGNREALTRRFFLFFQYESLPGRNMRDSNYAEIIGSIQTAAQNARAYFTQCGNIVQPKDEDSFTAEVLYMFFNRQSCS
jgi:hypothetical protein